MEEPGGCPHFSLPLCDAGGLVNFNGERWGKLYPSGKPGFT